jgi:hypothetical protein
LFENSEKLQRVSTNVCGTIGTVVSVGLENKNTKMSSVFKHYCKFVSKPNDVVCLDDLEFLHNDVLGNTDTAEGCAVMKGDKIYVRLQRKKERQEKDSKRLVQQESDKEYLKQLRGLFLESVNASSSEEHGFPASAGGPNLVLECRPYLEVGQRGVLNHFIKAHEGIVSKRCPWLKEKIVQARQDLEAARSRRKTAARECRDEQGQNKNRDGSSRVVTIPNVLEHGNSTREAVAVASAARPDGNVNDASSSSRSQDNSNNNNDDRSNDSDSKRNDVNARGGGGRAENNNNVARGSGRNQNQREEETDDSNMDDQHDDDDDAVMHVDNGEEDEQGERAAGARAQFHQIDDNDDDDDMNDGDGHGHEDDNNKNKTHNNNHNAHKHNNDNDNNSVDLLNEHRMDGQSDMLWVPLKSHPPEAVKLLLEYCYTNRVISLGKEAFTQAATAPANNQAQSQTTGPVPPYQSSLKWPNHGKPTVSMAVTLAGIALAEEARMPRLSLLCEVAASELVVDANVLDALASCTAQVQTSGNRLSLLRKKAMNHLLFVPLLKELGETKKWLNQLEEHKELVVPALLQGTEEMVALMNLHLHHHSHNGHGHHNNNHGRDHHRGDHGNHNHGHSYTSSSGSKRKKLHAAPEDRDKERQVFFETLDTKDRDRRRLERANRRMERKLGEHSGLSFRSKKVDFSDPAWRKKLSGILWPNQEPDIKEDGCLWVSR